jgi:hypothetical protein
MKTYFQFRWRLQLHGVLIQWNNKWVHIPCHNAHEAHKHCDMRNRTLPPHSSTVGQSDVYLSGAWSQSVSWLWSKICIKQITLLTFIFWQQSVPFYSN